MGLDFRSILNYIIYRVHELDDSCVESVWNISFFFDDQLFIHTRHIAWRRNVAYFLCVKRRTFYEGERIIGIVSSATPRVRQTTLRNYATCWKMWNLIAAVALMFVNLGIFQVGEFIENLVFFPFEEFVLLLGKLLTIWSVISGIELKLQWKLDGIFGSLIVKFWIFKLTCELSLKVIFKCLNIDWEVFTKGESSPPLPLLSSSVIMVKNSNNRENFLEVGFGHR